MIEKDLDFLLFGEKKSSKIKVEEKKLSPKHNISQAKTKVEEPKQELANKPVIIQKTSSYIYKPTSNAWSDSDQLFLYELSIQD